MLDTNLVSPGGHLACPQMAYVTRPDFDFFAGNSNFGITAGNSVPNQNLIYSFQSIPFEECTGTDGYEWTGL